MPHGLDHALSSEAHVEAAILRYQGELYAFAYRVLGDRSAAEDALQDTFVKAVRDGTQGAFPAGHERAWLYRVIHNACIDHLRRSRRQIHDSLDQVVGAS